MSRSVAGLTAAALVLPVAALACPEVAFPFDGPQFMMPRAVSTLSTLAFTAGLLALAVVSVRERRKPGFGAVLFSPGFLVGAALATTGAFFVRWLPLSSALRMGLSLPLPDMDQFLFGSSMDANPLFYSALVPALISAAGVRFQAARRLIAGVAVGFGGTMAAAAWHGWPELSVLSARWASLPWLVVNAAACAFIARAMFVAEARGTGSPRSEA